MRLRDLKCPECGNNIETLLKLGEQVLCNCGAEMEPVFNTSVQLFINDREKATNHSGTARYKEWAKSPATVERIRKGELVPESTVNANPLSDHLNCLDTNQVDSFESDLANRGI